MASAIISYAASLFGRDELADCVVVFYQEEDDREAGPPVKRRKTVGDAQPNDVGDAQPSAPASALGVPLPAHRMVLFASSGILRAQAERWTPEQQAGGSKPELRVPLGSPEDLPHALSALRFMYTGKVEGSSAAQLLQVRRHAAYLLVEGCVEACDAALLARVSAGASPQQAAVGATSTSSSSPLAPVAELFACRHLLPTGDELGAGDVLVSALLRACRQLLVLHSSGLAAVAGAADQGSSGGDKVGLGELLAWAFQDAPSLLCDPDSRRQMQALPATAMEALLGSDNLVTDDEATVLLVLAEWRKANKAAFAVACDKLCRLLRLSQLSEDYLLGTLPFIPWFPLSREEHASLCQYVLAAGNLEKRKRLEGHYDTTTPWYSAGARPCGRSDLNRPYGWHIKQEDLAEHAAQITAKKLYGRFRNGAQYLVSRGYFWRAHVKAAANSAVAGVHVACYVPAVLGLSSSGKRNGVVSTSIRVVVHGWTGQRRLVAFSKAFSTDEDYFKVDMTRGYRAALPLAEVQAAAAEGGEEVDPLHRWERYLRDGQLTGSLDFF